MVEISSLSNIVMVTLCTAFLWDNETVKNIYIPYTIYSTYCIYNNIGRYIGIGISFSEISVIGIGAEISYRSGPNIYHSIYTSVFAIVCILLYLP